MHILPYLLIFFLFYFIQLVTMSPYFFFTHGYFYVLGINMSLIKLLHNILLRSCLICFIFLGKDGLNSFEL
ncbi:hypothetical protein GLOIN_2v1723758 [Rhizophagus irregularis DAOM 181602=DAOM 197198]|uniref:Uncharacterized protein n=1 Tax=Rhizophagus irregularis (strain DAOM 181602 / DAOM 197198 / MUCL 43194) TaxID=747089 RepID=A0A2P4P1H6_RHIID|nr:hypothetical protein GLOIN_2v1723758 [Rhizophagus irregularis DAOM 181602=DAOM 197198]POG59246.1 hypothetical protein GLOIN_2v1723758 [Rhizophagus irregularis DAOM 181602=DAOM 197198]|eukprot:XP_025166112.1 hypothetical protein GLOIN_2v1723758 [Rhizophagus irregularis DAOM 181602=DAOM 197198]